MTWDVVVAGGGIAGIAAALAAKRAGAENVLLLEREFLLGGLATSGLITIYLPLCDGMGRQVSFSIAEELLRLSILRGVEERYPRPWLENGTDEEKQKTRFKVQFNPWHFAIDAEQLLLKEGVTLFYGAMACGADVENGSLKRLQIVHKSGHEWLEANAFVDATGDADIFWHAQAPTSEFQQGNLLSGWYYYATFEDDKLQKLGALDTPDEYKSEEAKASDTRKRYRALSGQELSDMTVESHVMLQTHFLERGMDEPGHRLSRVPIIPQVRMTRRVEGPVVFDDKDPYTYVNSSVGMIADWRKRGAAYELPYETLQSISLKNVYAAGRCISVTDSMWDITRVIPCCAVSGQAAGVAAACTKNRRAAALSDVQTELLRQGVPLHFAD